MLKTIPVLLIVVALSSCKSEGDDNHKHSISIEYDGVSIEYKLPYGSLIERQSRQQRVWKNVSATKFETISEDIYSPIRIALVDSTVYVLDPADGFVKAFQHGSEELRFIGPGKGPGPGEVSFPFEFAISKNGNFILTDIEKRSLIVWDRYGNPVIDYVLKHVIPANVAPLDEQNVLVMVSGSNITGIELFHIYNIEKNSTRLFSEFLTDADHLPPLVGLDRAFIGKVLSENDRIIYVPKHLNHIIHMSSDGEIELVRQTIDETSYPRIIQTGMNSSASFVSTSLSSDSEIANLDGFLAGENLIIWSRPGLIQYGHHVFDFYSKKNGDYQYSIGIPEIGGVAGLSINENFIATINSDSSVSLW